MITALSYLRSMGVVVSLDGDHTLDVRTQRRMPDDLWQQVLNLTKEHKPEILEDLKIEQDLGKLFYQIGAQVGPGPRLVFVPPLDGLNLSEKKSNAPG